jgi:hypothetical protein
MSAGRRCACGEEYTLIGETILDCLYCFTRNNAEQNVETLILRATLGIWNEPMVRKEAIANVYR